MADLDQRFEDNVLGKFYTDTECIGCRICGEVAPAFFRESDDGDHNIVHTQPREPDDIALAQEALDKCPVEAIGNDGVAAEPTTT